MKKIETRTAKIDLRVTPDVKATLQKAAEAERLSVSEFILRSVRSKADEALRQETVIKTSPPRRVLDANVSWARIEPSELTAVPCNICGRQDFDVLGSMLINGMEFFLQKCNKCGLIWRNPLPGPTFSNGLYSDAYFSVEKHSPSLVDQVGIRDTGVDSKAFREEISKKVVQTWIDRGIQPFRQQQHSESKPAGKRLLEIGGGRAYLQRAAENRGWETTGIEISPHGIKEAINRKSFVLPITIDELCNRFVPYEKFFDVVVAYDFLEHVENPAKVLRMIRSLLADDGFFIFRVPSTVGPPTLHLIDHLFHFSVSTLPLLLIKELFKVVGAHLSGVFRPQNGKPIDNVTIYAQKTSTATSVTEPLTFDENPLGGDVPPVPHG